MPQSIPAALVSDGSLYSLQLDDAGGAVLARTEDNAAWELRDVVLGNSAARNVGTTTGTVAAGDDARIVGAAPLVSPHFDGVPTTVTLAAGDSDTGIVNFEAMQDALNVKADSDSLQAHIDDTGNPHSVTAEQIGLGNVDNTSDSDKRISDATQDALDLKASASSLSSHVVNTSNPHSVTKTQVSLGNVDNTSDANKPVSTATQTALNAKAPSSAVLPLVVAVSSANITLTAAQVTNRLIALRGALTANINIVCPDVVFATTISNEATGAFTITIKRASTAGTILDAATTANFYYDGS